MAGQTGWSQGTEAPHALREVSAIFRRLGALTDGDQWPLHPEGWLPRRPVQALPPLSPACVAVLLDSRQGHRGLKETETFLPPLPSDSPVPCVLVR
jgi:hypothetical protein